MTEQKKGNNISYCYEIYSKKIKTYEEDINFIATSSKVDDFIFFLLYDEYYMPISSAFEFLNYTLKKQSVNTRSRHNEALKFLYCFQKIVGKNFKEFHLKEYTMFENFLLGGSFNGDLIEMNLMTERSAATYNGYMSTYRKYAEFLQIDAKLLNATTSYYLLDINTKVKKYKTNAKSIAPIMQEVPDYISLPEFVKIINIVRTEYSVREEIIIRLMYESGMRIGEVLGLTADDIRMEKYKGKYTGTVYIRNRISNEKYQCAKTCSNVINKSDYRRKEYRTKDYGYQYVFISKELYDLINEYIEQTHVWAGENKKERYYKKTIADRVDDDLEMDDINYYIFINSQGSRLAGSSWNKIIKKIYIKAGIILDKGKKEVNLNHRLRHGFAMFNVQYLHTDAEELRIKMRHSEIKSVLIYLQYTKEDKIKIKDKYTNELYDLVPALKEINNERS